MRASMATWRTSSLDRGIHVVSRSRLSERQCRIVRTKGRGLVPQARIVRTIRRGRGGDLAAAGDEHPRRGRAACRANRERTPADHDQRQAHAVDGRWLTEEAEYEPAPVEQQDTCDQEGPEPDPHFGSKALNCSSSRTLTFSFCAFSSLEPAPGPATT